MKNGASFYKLIFVFCFIFALFVFLGHYLIVGSSVWGDGQYYYSYTRSLIVDGDINFKNEFEYFSLPIKKTPTGMVGNKFSLGAGLLWLPFLGLAHLVAKGDGFSNIYQILTGFGNVFYGILGLWFCFKIVKKYFSKKIALMATLSLWLGSNLFFYTAVDPINSHSVSFFVASIIILVWQQINPQKLSQFAVLGFLIGLLAMIRTQDVIFAGPFLIWSFKDWQENKQLVLKRTLVLLVFTFIGFLPQMLVWQTLFGELKSPYLIFGERFNWLKPRIGAVLLSPGNGLFFYSPILIFSLVGLYFLFKKSRFLAVSGFFLFLLQTYIVSSWHSWSGGAAYGGRMFISLMPFYIIGLATLLEKLKLKQKLGRCILFALVILNFVSIIRFLSMN